MTKKVLYWRGKFDPAWEFTANKMLTIEGDTFHPGDPFDKTKVTVRRLRQMFETRKLARMISDEEIEDSEQKADRLAAAKQRLIDLLISEGADPDKLDDDWLARVAESTADQSDDDIRAAIRVSGVLSVDDDISPEDEDKLVVGLEEAREHVARLASWSDAWRVLTEGRPEPSATVAATAPAAVAPEPAPSPSPAPARRGRGR